jgi:hypothetical protein
MASFSSCRHTFGPPALPQALDLLVEKKIHDMFNKVRKTFPVRANTRSRWKPAKSLVKASGAVPQWIWLTVVLATVVITVISPARFLPPHVGYLEKPTRLAVSAAFQARRPSRQIWKHDVA